MLYLLFAIGLTAKWDHQLYLCGDNDLEYFSIQDLDEAYKAFTQNAALHDSVRFTVLYDRAKSGVRNAVDDPLGHLYDKNGKSISGTFDNTKLIRWDQDLTGWREIEEMGNIHELNTASPSTLKDFIYKTVDVSMDKHFLEFWNHGAAYVGFGVDESAGNHALLSLEDIYNGINDGIQTIKNTKSGASNFKYTIIGFDACLMSNFVVTSALGQFTDYFLFSEEVEPGYGWDYKGLVAGNTAEEYARNMIDEFFDYGNQNPRTLCLVQVSLFNEFKTAFDKMIDFAMQRLDQFDVDVYNAIQQAGTYSKKVDGAGIDLGGFLSNLKSYLPPECNKPSYFYLTDLEKKYNDMFVHQKNSDDRYTGMSIYWPSSGSSYLTSHYNRLPSTFGHSKWDKLIKKLDQVKSDVQNNGVKGYCLTGTNNQWDGKNFTMSDYSSTITGGRIRLSATMSSNVGETYADYGIETGSSVEVYGSTDGTIAEQGSGDSKTFLLNVDWDKHGTYLKDGNREVLMFSYVTYLDDGTLTITAPLKYFPSGVTPAQSGGQYKVSATDGARDATLFISVDATSPTAVSTFTLYAGSGTEEGSPKAEVRPSAGGSIVIASYKNTFSNFHKSNTVEYKEMFEWKDEIDVIRKSTSGIQVWYMRGVAATGDMLVYTVKKVNAQGQTTATGTEQLNDYPSSNSSGGKGAAIDEVGGAGGIIGMAFAVIVIGGCVVFCGQKPDKAIGILDGITGGAVSGMLAGGGDEEDGGATGVSGGLDMKEAVRPSWE